MTLVKNSMSLTEWHEKSFWTLYEKYSHKIQEVTPQRYRVIDDLAKAQRKYLNEMNAAIGPSLAARFLAWEDYYSLVSKMYAWSTAN